MIRPLVSLLSGLALSTLSFAQTTPPAPLDFSNPYAVFAPLLGKTFYGVSTDPASPEVTDTQRFSLALGGQAIRIEHALGDGCYGGETIVFFDPARQTLIYHYFTTAGFHTIGEIFPVELGGYSAVETVEGHPEITRVRADVRVRERGLATRTAYERNGEWEIGHGFDYVEAPQAEIVLNPDGAACAG
ncbi:MAG: hypothetical protein ACFB2Z_01530 [Maricaulaceae bacterium]